MEIKRKEEVVGNEWYGSDEMVMLGSKCLWLTEKEEGEKQGWEGGGEGHRTRKKKKRKY